MLRDLLEEGTVAPGLEPDEHTVRHQPGRMHRRTARLSRAQVQEVWSGTGTYNVLRLLLVNLRITFLSVCMCCPQAAVRLPGGPAPHAAAALRGPPAAGDRVRAVSRF